MRTRLKVCCISSLEEARTAVECGADALGLVGPMPSGPGVIDNDLIARIAPTVPPAVATFLLTSHTDPDLIIRHALACGTNTVQIVDEVPAHTYPLLRQGLGPAIRLVQVLHVWDDSALEHARAVLPQVDALLLDSGSPRPAPGQVKTLGGTGLVHNWAISRQIAELARTASRPVFLAGGLSAANAEQAIRAVRPFGLDVCSGVRTNGRLDATKLVAMLEAMALACD